LDRIKDVKDQYPTPFYIYDEAAIRENAKALIKAFDWCPGFKEYFAVKATPNPRIVDALREEGFGADCSSLAELILCERLGIRGEEIMFTSNNTMSEDYKKAKELGAVINLDDISHIEYLHESVGMPELICFRYNPGPLRSGNAIIGEPQEAKYGFTREQLFEGYKKAKGLGATRFGLHTMVASNELDPQFFIDTAEMLFELVNAIHAELGIKIEFVNLGGGMGIPYKPEDKPLDLNRISAGIKELYDTHIASTELDPLSIYLENGRIITGPYGYLVTEVVHKKDTYKNYVGVDACMANLMRPGMYGAYHHISVLGKEDAPATTTVDVVGSLCENNDKFAIDREMPQMEIGDIAVIHDSGAHGHSMGFQYNGKLRCAELLLKTDGTVEEIRRAETLDDYFATLMLDKVVEAV
jgi:diaminopimelate decarboxylase